MDTDYDTQVDIPELDDSPDPNEPCNPETPYSPCGPIYDNWGVIWISYLNL